MANAIAPKRTARPEQLRNNMTDPGFGSGHHVSHRSQSPEDVHRYGVTVTAGLPSRIAFRRSTSAWCDRRNSAFFPSDGVGGAAPGLPAKRSASAIAIDSTK